MRKHWKCQSSLDIFSENKLQEFAYSHQEPHFVRDAFKFCLIPKNHTEATRGQTDQFWLKKVEEQPSHWKKVQLLFLMLNPLKTFSFPPFKSNIFPLQVLPLTNQNHWLLKWNLLNTYYTDTVHEKKEQGFSCYHILVKNCREEYFNYYNCFISISKNTHFSYYWCSKIQQVLEAADVPL